MTHETMVVEASNLEVKEEGDLGIVTAYASMFNNVDLGNDRVLPGAFTRTLRERASKVIYLPSHDYRAHIKDIPGVPVVIEEDSNGLKTITKFFLNTQAGKDSFAVIKAYQAAGRPLGLSFSYDTVKSEFDKEGVRNLQDLELFEYGHCPLPMNELARTTDAKAEWTASYINDLADSAFAYVEPGGSKDEDGRTTPRSLRHLPHHDSGGAVDEAHLRNALSRESQTDISAEGHSTASRHLKRHASAMGIGASSLQKLESLLDHIDLHEALGLLQQVHGESCDKGECLLSKAPTSSGDNPDSKAELEAALAAYKIRRN